MTHEHALRTLAAERYLLDEMNELERQQFEAHYFDCAECADDVRTGVQMADGVREAERRRPATVVPFVPARPAPRRLATYLPIAVAASLALVTSYQALVTIPALRAGQGPRALAPVVLRSASRGELPEITKPASGDVLLSLDVNFASSPAELIYDLTADTGALIVRQRAALPPPGIPLLILVPGTFLAAGRYQVAVRDPATPQSEAALYPFVVR